MGIKDRIQECIEKGRATELDLIASQSEAERAFEGSYENWSVKDVIAHVNYWQDVRTRRIRAWIDGHELAPLPHYEQANAACYTQYQNHSWAAIEDFARHTHGQLVSLVADIDADDLSGPSEESQDRKVWETLVGAAYTHKLAHYAEIYTARSQAEVASRLWGEWAALVSPLDDGADWQGGVHYNAACSLALAGDQQGALEELRLGLELRPNLRPWSRRDSDLDSLHDLPAYKELYAPTYWWTAIEAGPHADALADQYLRLFSMIRIAINNCPAEQWLQGETRYRRPAALALHVLQSIAYYSALQSGDQLEDALMQVGWQEGDAAKLPTQHDLLRFWDEVEKRSANFVAKADLAAQEELFPWAGMTVLGRAMFALRHAQHHLADLIAEIDRPDAPEWFE